MECLHDNLDIITESLKRNWYVLHLYIAKLLSVPYKYHSLCKILTLYAYKHLTFLRMKYIASLKLLKDYRIFDFYS